MLLEDKIYTDLTIKGINNCNVDLNKKIISVNDAFENEIIENPNKIIGLISIAIENNLELDQNTKDIICKNIDNIKNIDFKDIKDDLTNILISNPERFIDLYDFKITDIIMPDFNAMVGCEQNNPHHCFDVVTHTLKSIEALPEKTEMLCWTMLLHDIGKPVVKETDENGIDHFKSHANASVEIAEKIVNDFDLKNKDEILFLVKYHDIQIETKKTAKKYLEKYGMNWINDLKTVRNADLAAQDPVYLYEEKVKLNQDTFKLFDDIIAEKENMGFTKKDLKISGKELMSIGYTGANIGNEINKLVDIVSNDLSLNTAEKLIEIATNDFINKDSIFYDNRS
jgi:tRNA nucleotidyltransferase (CCA-adding enzyme)